MLESLLFFGALGVSAISNSIKDKQALSTPVYNLPNGIGVYMDAHGKSYINGEKIEKKLYFDQYHQSHWVYQGISSKTIYYDPYKEKCEKYDEWNRKSKEKAIQEGYKVYKKKYAHLDGREFLTEINEDGTDGRRVMLQYAKNGKFFLYYFTDDKSPIGKGTPDVANFIILTSEEAIKYQPTYKVE